MKNKTCNTEELVQNEVINEQLHGIKKTIDIVLASVLGFTLLICGYYYALYGFMQFCEEMFFILLIAFAAVCIACLCVSGNLEYCYRYYRCKECGHIHRLNVNDFERSTGLPHCPNCDKYTQHKKMPVKRKK